MEKCSQCRNKAIYEIEGIQFCLTCYEKIHKIQMEQHWLLTSQMNDIIQNVEITAGVPLGTLGRHRMPEPVNNTTINIDRSIVGTINTGYANEIYSNLNNINQNTESEIILKFKNFTEELSSSIEVSNELKSEILERMAFLSEELTKEEKSRKSSMIRDNIDSISKVILSSTALYEVFKPIIAYFL